MDNDIQEIQTEVRGYILQSIERMRGSEIRTAASDLPQFVFDKLNAYEIGHIAGLILTAKVVAEKETLQEVRKQIKAMRDRLKK